MVPPLVCYMLAPVPPRPVPSAAPTAAQIAAAARVAATKGTATPAVMTKRQAPTPVSSSKKRPYRRTKRPKNYCDKSTITTTTQTAHTPVNVYDAVLGECEDLLKASLESQRLGRLKMASAYQLLLHTRLIGLGKRFDRATIMAPPPPRKRRTDDDDDDEEGGDVKAGGRLLQYATDGPSTSLAGTAAAATAVPVQGQEPETPNNLPPALKQLTSILPSNLEMDSSMMEHLARAAVELHHQRTGRKKSADGLLASPVNGGIISTPEPGPADALANLMNQQHDANGASVASGNSPTSKLAWTPQEHEIVEKAMGQKKSASAISKLLKNKTETQVKAYLRNKKAKDSIKHALNDDNDGEDDEDDGEEETPSKKRGGRGRKPPTTAMNTVPNANLDAKSLLKGLKRGI